MQRSVLLELADQAAARSMATLFPIEQHLSRESEKIGHSDLTLKLALIQQLEAIRLTLCASIAEDE